MKLFVSLYGLDCLTCFRGSKRSKDRQRYSPSLNPEVLYETWSWRYGRHWQLCSQKMPLAGTVDVLSPSEPRGLVGHSYYSTISSMRMRRAAMWWIFAGTPEERISVPWVTVGGHLRPSMGRVWFETARPPSLPINSTRIRCQEVLQLRRRLDKFCVMGYE